MPNDLDDILGFHLRLAYGAVLRHFTEHFAELGLTQKQVSVLWLAHDHPGIAQTELAARLQMDRASTMAMVHALERRGLLARGHAAHDKRRVALSLTSEGADALTRARSAIATHEAWLKSKFRPDEVEQLAGLLRRIHD